MRDVAAAQQDPRPVVIAGAIVADRQSGSTLPVMRDRRSGSWECVEAARRQARLALGKDPDGADDYGGRPKPRTEHPAAAPARIAYGPGVAVETLPIEFGSVVPTREVERLAEP